MIPLDHGSRARKILLYQLTPVVETFTVSRVSLISNKNTIKLPFDIIQIYLSISKNVTVMCSTWNNIQTLHSQTNNSLTKKEKCKNITINVCNFVLIEYIIKTNLLAHSVKNTLLFFKKLKIKIEFLFDRLHQYHVFQLPPVLQSE